MDKFVQQRASTTAGAMALAKELQTSLWGTNRTSSTDTTSVLPSHHTHDPPSHTTTLGRCCIDCWLFPQALQVASSACACSFRQAFVLFVMYIKWKSVALHHGFSSHPAPALTQHTHTPSYSIHPPPPTQIPRSTMNQYPLQTGDQSPVTHICHCTAERTAS